MARPLRRLGARARDRQRHGLRRVQQGHARDVAQPVVTDTYQPAGSYAVALDARTGRLRWKSERLDDGNAANGTFVNATPVAFEAGGRDLVFVPMSGGSGDGARVPMYFLDARTGKTVRKAFSLTDAEYRRGFGGTGIWSTPAYDPVGVTSTPAPPTPTARASTRTTTRS